MDSTDPDLSSFSARGGKLIMYENMADYAQSPYAGIDYYKSVVAKMGTAKAENFLRLYVTPGADHMGMGAPSSVDMCSADGALAGKDIPVGIYQAFYHPITFLGPWEALSDKTIARVPTRLLLSGLLVFA